MKKRVIPIAAGAAVILALALTLASPRTPSMHVASVNTDHIVLETGGDCGYSVAQSRADL